MRYLLLFILPLLLIQCNQQLPDNKKVGDLVPADPAKKPGDNLYQTWEVTDADHPLFKDVMDPGDSTDEGNSPGIVFLPDSVIVENPKGQMRYGKFTMKGKKIDVVFEDGGKAIYTIKFLRPQKMQLQRNEKGGNVVLELKSDGYVYHDPKKNPFNILYNQWRVKPKQPESREALKERVKQYVQFYTIYFNDNLQREATEIDFRGLPSCFIWYKGGIGITSERHTRTKFIECFYSKEQAMQARQMLEDAILKKYKWVAGEPNWIKQTAPVLQQIADNL